MRTGRSYIKTAIAIGAIVLGGCAADSNVDVAPRAPNGDFGEVKDLRTHFQGLTTLANAPTFDEATGLLAVELDSDESVLFSLRAVDSAILVNGATVLDTGVLATKTSVKKITVGLAAGETGGDEQVIFDFLGGTFALGTASDEGIEIDLGDEAVADEVSIRGTTGKDAWYIGTDGKLSFGNDDNLDAAFTGVEKLVLALAAGDDTFSANPGASPGVKGAVGTASIAVTVYGGAGKDVLTGGAGADKLWGGLGDDTLDGGDGLDDLNGEDGADTFNMGAADDTAKDVVVCGTGVDTVSYALRTAGVVAKLGTDTGFTVEDTLNDDCDNLVGGDGDDYLFGGSIANVITGGKGNDVLSGGGGDDTLNGNDGDDVFVEGIVAGAIVIGAGADTFNGHAGVDMIVYGPFAAVASKTPAVTGRTAALNVTMDGKANNDGETNEKDNVKGDVEDIVVGKGGGTYVGNALNNTFFQGPDADKSADIMSGGDGIDTVDYSERTGAVIATMGDDLANDGIATELDNIKSDIENLVSGTGVDNVTGNDLDNYLDLGTGAAQTVHCGNGDDIALGTTLTTTSGCEILEN